MTDVRRMRVAIALGMLTIGACTQATLNKASEEQAIREAGLEWQRAIAAKDVDRILAVHAPDVTIMAGGAPLASGIAAVRPGYAMMVGLPGYQVSWTPTRIDVASPTVATETGTYVESYDGPNGKINDRGNYTTIWHKINGKWLVATDAIVSSMPPAAAGSVATDVMDMSDAQMLASANVAWADFRPPGFDPGVKLAVLHGDPSKKGDYTLRLQFPDGYKFPVHWHPGGEHLTVLSGTFLLGMGSSNDWNAVRSYGPGDFVYAPARNPHYGGARGTTVVQLHGDGPFQLILGAPK